MSKSTQALRDFLTVSPSVVYPDEVLELLQPVEDENAKLREFAALVLRITTHNEPMFVWQGMVNDARELGIEVDDDD